MVFWMTMSCLKFIILFVLVLDKTDHVRTEENKSFFSFFHTGKTSPMNIEDSCFDIDQDLVNRMYLGISLFVHKNTSCKPENIGLKEVYKYIIHDKHQRQLCRTKLTVSLNSINCEKAIENLEFICQHLDKKSTIFFQDCMVDSFLEKNETITESGAIIISAFPTPNMSELRHKYEIPTAHCNMKKCELKNANKVREFGTSLSKDTSYPDSDKGSAQLVLIQAIVSGCVGLILGVLSTSFVCICIYKQSQSRIINEGLFSKSNIHRMNETERIFSIHSKEDEIVYHDIMDIEEVSNNKDIQHSVNDVFYHFDPPEQRYSESPKSSTSTYENEFGISQFSVNKATKSSKEHTSRKEQSGMYHKLSKENKFPLTSTKNEDLFESRNVDTENTATGKTVASSLKSEHNKQYAAYEVPVSHSNAKISRDIGSKTIAMSDLNGNNEDLTTTVYHVLEKK